MKRCVEQQPRNRREMLCGAARGAALGGLAWLSAALIVRGGRPGGGVQCPLGRAAVQLPPQHAQDGTAVALPSQQRAVCGNCPALARCQLPGGAAARPRGKG
jgi:hypothetical protein